SRALRLELVCEDLLQLLGVWAAVVDRGGGLGVENFARELGDRGALHLVVVGGAHVERSTEVLVARVRERRGGVRWRDHQVALRRQHRHGRDRGARAARADDRDDLRIRDERLGVSLAVLRIAAAGIRALEVDVVAGDLPAVLDRHLHAGDAVKAERSRRTGDRKCGRKDDLVAFGDLYAAELVGVAYGRGVARGGSRTARCVAAPR